MDKMLYVASLSLANTLSGKPSLIFWANNTDKNILIVNLMNPKC